MDDQNKNFMMANKSNAIKNSVTSLQEDYQAILINVYYNGNFFFLFHKMQRKNVKQVWVKITGLTYIIKTLVTAISHL